MNSDSDLRENASSGAVPPATAVSFSKAAPPSSAASAPPPSALAHRDGTAESAPSVTGGKAGLHNRIIETLKTIHDPEIPVDIYELGLIYEIKIESFPHVVIEMTLTSPNCPEAQTLPMAVKYKIEAIPGVVSAEVRVVWDPPWAPDFMSDGAKLALNML